MASVGISKSGAVIKVTTPPVDILNRALSLSDIEKLIESPSGSEAETVKALVWFSITEIAKEELLIVGALLVLP